MDSYTIGILESLAEVLVAAGAAGVRVYAPDAEGSVVERGRVGPGSVSLPLVAVPVSERGWLQAIEDAKAGGGGWSVLTVEIPGRNGTALGHLHALAPHGAETALRELIDALRRHVGAMLEQGALYQELQHSFNQLFIVYEAGRLLNLSHAADEVLTQVITLLVDTLHVAHCAVWLLDGTVLRRAAQAGLVDRWRADDTIALEHTFGARVLEAGAVAQAGHGRDLVGLTLPQLASGDRPSHILSAVLTTRAGVLGFLELYRESGDAFTADELFVASVLAVETAAALENARLYDALREREERLTHYAGKLVTSQEEERRRIARDIHDGLGQMIVSAVQYLQAHEYALPADYSREALQRGVEILHECIAEARRVMSDLRPSILDDFGLVVALQQQLNSVAEATGWEAQFVVDGVITRLPPAVETTIFRVVQEALTNARRHAGAERVALTLARRNDTVRVEVRDWGRGFVAAGVAVHPDRGQHLGLMGMRERVALLGGSVEIDSTPGEGTTVSIVLPVG